MKEWLVEYADGYLTTFRAEYVSDAHRQAIFGIGLHGEIVRIEWRGEYTQHQEEEHEA